MKKVTNISTIEILLKQLRTQKILLGVVCVFMALFIAFSIFCMQQFHQFKTNISDITAKVSTVANSDIGNTLNNINSEDIADFFDEENLNTLKELSGDMKVLKDMDIDIEKFSDSIAEINKMIEPVKNILNSRY